MNKLMIFYRDPAKGSEEHYWNALCDTSASSFERACDIILDTHKIKDFPLIPIFHEAISQAGRDGSGSLFPSFNCPFCRGIGLTVTDDKNGFVAHPCSCDKGQIYRRAFDKCRAKSEIKRAAMMPEHVEETKEPY